MADEAKDVSGNPSPVVSEDKKTQAGQEDNPTPGSKTPDNQLYAALKEERTYRKNLEDKLLKLEEELVSLRESSVSSETDDGYGDEGLKKEVSVLKHQVSSLQEDIVLKELQAKYPALQEKLVEFNEYRKDYPANKLENVVKLFLSEEGLLQEAAPRKGLEKSTGGSKTPAPAESYTVEEVRKIRETNPKLYEKLVIERRIK